MIFLKSEFCGFHKKNKSFIQFAMEAEELQKKSVQCIGGNPVELHLGIILGQVGWVPSNSNYNYNCNYLLELSLAKRLFENVNRFKFF